MKKIIKFSCMLVMIWMLTGCVKMNADIEIKEDKTANMHMKILIKESTLNNNSNPFIKQIEDEIASHDEFRNVKIESISESINGDNWVGIQGNGGVIIENEYIREKNNDGVRSLVVTIPMRELRDEMDISQIMNTTDSFSQLKSLGVEMKVKIRMPHQITSNYGVVKGDTVTIDLLELLVSGKDEDIIIGSPIEKASYMPYVWGGIGILAVIGAVIFMKMRKG